MITKSSASDCALGFYGENCSLPCKYPNYGENCQQHCSNCSQQQCSPTFGCHHTGREYWTTYS